VNGFTWGLDGWLHGSSGLFGGQVTSLLTGKNVDLSGRDFRLKPDTGEIEPVAGLSQMGRVRDDFDQWFGNDNSTLLWHYPLPDHYLRRNPHVTYPEPRVLVSAGADANQLFPTSRTLERFNDPQMANRTTSACGPEIYRDVLLGSNYYRSAFICEPVHNLVTRRMLEPDGVSFTARRAPDEQRSEFLASTDNWFRPVQVRTGPDGALWIVDMYRFVVEHPRWIPSNRLAQLDVRAGADKGRIYRVYPQTAKLRPIADFTKMNAAQLAERLNTPNGPIRDLVHRQLLNRSAAVPARSGSGQIESRENSKDSTSTMDSSGAGALVMRLEGIALSNSIPAVRAQALWAMEGAGGLTPQVLQTALGDAHPGVRRQAIRLAEPWLTTTGNRNLGANADLKMMLLNRVDDSDPGARFQFSLSAGQWKEPGIGQALGKLALSNPDDPWLRAAVLSSAPLHAMEIFRAIDTMTGMPAHMKFAGQLVASSADVPDQFEEMFVTIGCMRATNEPVWWFGLLANLLDALERKDETFLSYSSKVSNVARLSALNMGNAFAAARQTAADEAASEEAREAALQLLGREIIPPNPPPELPYRKADERPGDFAQVTAKEIELLGGLVTSGRSARLRQAASQRLKRLRSPQVPVVLLKEWASQSPLQRAAIISVLLSRDEWIDALLEALEHSTLSQGEIALPDRERLLKSAKIPIRDRAQKLFSAQRPSTRTEILASYRNVSSLAGHMERGSAVFEKNCAPCHAFRGRGHAVGANLGEFVGKSVDDFVLAIFDPNAAINPNFIAYNIETKDGRSLNGIVKGETASSLTLLQGGGVEEKILRSDLKEIRASQLSLMPEGLEQSMTPQDVADLIAWLRSSGPKPFGSASGAQTAKARAEFLDAGCNGLATLLKSGADLPYASWLGHLPMAYCRQDAGMNRLAWKTASVPKTLSADGTYPFRLAAAMGFASQPAGKFTLRLNGQTEFDFDVALSDQSWQSSDGRVRMSYTVMENNAEDSNGVLVIEAHASRLKPGESAQFEVIGSNARSQRWFGIYLLPNTGQSVAAGR
jgi:putative heme-binding domain-containing protein